MRGCDVNYCGLNTGKTPMHWAIEHGLPCCYIKFLLKNKANPHIEDADGKDCCDKAKLNPRYVKMKTLTCEDCGCSKDPSLRIKIGGQIIKQGLSKNLSIKVNSEFVKLQAQ